MFKVDLSENRLVQLDERRFSELQLNEREHLQEWLVKMPEALGEELLVIQKEFDGFEDTRERLDLLALDKEGRVVVIENKLDDSGRDVVWQALKYVAYCSSLKKAEIVDIYQKYLDRWFNGENAVPNLCEFLDVEDLDDSVLNEGNNQRLMLVAANFRKEVTSTVLWLIGHGVRAQCFRVAPFGFGQEILIDLQQIIPTPEAADYMIGMADKESEEKSSKHKRKLSEEKRQAFWTKTLEALRVRGISRYEKINPSRKSWLASPTGLSGCGYNLAFSKDMARVELYLGRTRADENKRIFDQLKRQMREIEDRFGAALDWQRLDDKKSCRICIHRPFDINDNENWPEMIEWICKYIIKLEEAFSEPLGRLNELMKSRGEVLTTAENDSSEIRKSEASTADTIEVV